MSIVARRDTLAFIVFVTMGSAIPCVTVSVAWSPVVILYQSPVTY